ncbi:MAG: LPXTG cell wall anchor domain-containing protein [Oscillospiraceae bacterium]
MPRTGSRGTWIYPVVGVIVACLAGGTVFLLKKKHKN